MKLFKVVGFNNDEYSNDIEQLVVTETSSEAIEKVKEEYSDFLQYFGEFYADEIKEVDGYRITLEKIEG